MHSWTDLFRRPPRLSEKAASAWFACIADELLNRSAWLVGGIPHRFIDVEFYYRGSAHADPFAHAHPMQADSGRWYFHRTGNAYRGGSFKGIDLTFGDGEARAGILIRGIETAEGHLIDGPSLVVDRLLEWCNQRIVSQLDQIVGARTAWNPTCPLRITRAAELGREILACARVGLSLRRARAGSTMPAYLTRPYRFLSEPRRIAKGKAQMAMALLRRGCSAMEIGVATGSPLRSIEVYLAEYAAGLCSGSLEEYFGKDLGPRDLCRLHGIADRR